MKTLKELLELRDALTAKIKAAVDLGDALTDDGATQLENDLAEARKLDSDIEKRQSQNNARQSAADWLQPREPRTQSNSRQAPDLQMNQRNRRDPVDNPDGSLYSVRRVMLTIMDDGKLDGYELECSQEIRKRYPQPAGVATRNNSHYAIPWNLPIDYRTAQNYMSRNGLTESRALNLSAGAGGIWPQQELTMIDLLRAKNGLMRMGCAVFTGVVGNKLVFPKQTGTTTGYWLAEAGAPTGSNMTVGTVEVVPKTCGAYSDLTRSLLQQQSIDFEQAARVDIVTTVAITMDGAGFTGTGSSNQPQGMLGDSSIPTVALGTNGGEPTWEKMIEMKKTVQAANYEADTFRYVGNADVECKLETTLVKENTAALFIMRDGKVNGRPVFTTNLMPNNLEKGTGEDLSSMIYGDFSQYIIAMWGSLDLMLDPYALATSGGRRIIALQDVGMKPRQPAAFSKIVDMITTLE